MSAIRGGRQAPISLMLDFDAAGCSFLLVSILSTTLKKAVLWCLDSSSFFLIIDDMVALECILNGCCKFHVPFCIRSIASKTIFASSNKDNPLDIAWVIISSVTQLLCPLSLFILPLDLQFPRVFISELLVMHSKELNEIILLQIHPPPDSTEGH